MIDARAVWLQQAPQQLANTTLPIGNEYFMLPRTLFFSAIWILPWKARKKTTACVPCEEKANQLLSNILSASMCETVYQQLMTIAIPPTRPTSLSILGSRCCISDSDGAISPTVSSVSTLLTL